ncbi:MAG TPA: hypothetical protein PLG99_03500, partial [Kaistiaceae bacterium]|nr:hypothetical protein [Kaistiaceae bacterium]
LTPAGRIFAEYAEQILDLRRRAQDAINELERVPRGALLIAAIFPAIWAKVRPVLSRAEMTAAASIVRITQLFFFMASPTSAT